MNRISESILKVTDKQSIIIRNLSKGKFHMQPDINTTRNFQTTKP